MPSVTARKSSRSSGETSHVLSLLSLTWQCVKSAAWTRKRKRFGYSTERDEVRESTDSPTRTKITPSAKRDSDSSRSGGDASVRVPG
ncbi:hypothetical protein E2C01_090485 [Portunus trituberculatus]|uniref:Uncharacterized protein n=1 Tax=Portunus trituberculatus TaxID=210409 RepID=A0A5B7JLI1_PORTR|nr:hypothetical protein [Portunus trituberculatus]